MNILYLENKIEKWLHIFENVRKMEKPGKNENKKESK